MLACFTFQLDSTLLLKRILPALNRRFIEKQLHRRKFSGNPNRNFRTLSKLSEQLLLSIFLFSDNLQLINLRTREYCTFPISNLSCTPTLVQRHYKLSKSEKNGITGIIFFFLQNYLSPVDSGRKKSEASIEFRRSCFTK